MLAIDKRPLHSQISEIKTSKIYFFALLTPIFFGLANYLTAINSKKHGLIAVLPTFFGSTFMWIFYHLYKLRQNKKFSKQYSAYYRPIKDPETL